MDPPRARAPGAAYWRVTFEIAEDKLDEEVDEIARFDREAIARTKFHVDQATLPADHELAAASPDFFEAFGRSGPLARPGSSCSASTPTAT